MQRKRNSVTVKVSSTIPPFTRPLVYYSNNNKLFVMNNYGKNLLSLSKGYQLVGRWNRKYGSVEIADLDSIDMGFTDYDRHRGASDKVLTMLCDSLYDRCLLQELGLFEQKVESQDCLTTLIHDEVVVS